MDHLLIRKVRRRDRIARWIITFGGILIVISVLGILLLIAEVALPLFAPATQQMVARFRAPSTAQPALAVGVDEYLETAYTLSPEGVFTFFDAHDGRTLRGEALARPAPAARVVAAEGTARLRYTLLWSDGTVTLERLVFRPVFDAAGRRTIASTLERLARFAPGPGAAPTRLAVARAAGDEGAVLARLTADGRLRVTRQVVATSLLGESTTETHTLDVADLPDAPLSAMTLDSAGDTLYLGTADGRLARWDLREPGEARPLGEVQAFADGRAVTALTLLLGDISLAVGDERGGHATWFPVPAEDGTKRLRRIHPLQPHQAPVTRILATANNKALLSVSADGRLLYDYTTNQRHLLSLTPAQPPAAVGLSTRSNGAIAIDGVGEVTLWALHVPHPEASWRTFFGKLWYEGFPEPDYTWQSSAGTEDFEPKLSLVPLIFGTVKGTLYGLLFAAPLAVFAALYSSHLMNPRLHRVIKPTFEIMGAIPTVVIGFIAALWLAPLVRVSLGALLLLLVLLPLLVMLGVGVWERLTALDAVRKVLRGYEFLLLVPVVLLGVGLAAVAGRVLEVWLFGGDLPLWLFQHLGVHFDQRNSIIIAFGLGFAVLPTVYTISDDALTNVPRNLTAASLALGASRWQTVWRVVLPSASPGIFAALMVGFGRAVGETMIVLMATGNTPITDWSIFNGMRTLSANIAVEIPEAPFEGTLYRTLFLSAVLLFLTTFVLNTAAEMVRQRLRKKFGQF